MYEQNRNQTLILMSDSAVSRLITNIPNDFSV